MQIEQIEISNFKGIQEEKFAFTPEVNLIIGDNGTGKTSVLEAISVALGGFLAGIGEVRGVHFSTDEIRRENELLGDGSNTIKYKTPVKVECDLKIEEEAFHFVRQKKSVKSSRSTVEPRDICKKAALMTENSSTVLPVISYQGISRIANQKREGWVDVFKSDFSRAVAYIDCLGEASNMKQMTNWFARMEQISWQEDKRIAEYEIVKKAVGIFMSEMLEQKTIRVFYDKRTEELMYRNEEEVLPIRLLSSGFRTLIGMVLDIAYRMAVLNPMLGDKVLEDTSGVVVIDEIDLHLHPQWQQTIISDLNTIFPKIQFIVSSHAPAVINSVAREQIRILDNGEIYMPAAQTYGRDANSILREVMKVSERPTDIKQRMNLFYSYMDENNYKEANNVLTEIEAIVGTTDPDIAAARTSLDLEKILGE